MGAPVRADRPLGVENAAGWGRHTAIFLAGRGYDVRDVCANRTPRQDRGRQRGKSDTLDSERIARETLVSAASGVRRGRAVCCGSLVRQKSWTNWAHVTE